MSKAVSLKKIGVMVGSISDLPQCEEGLKLLREAEDAGKVEMIVFCVNSIHRNTEDALKNLHDYTLIFGVERWIIAAGMANHLTGTCDAFLRYGMNSEVPVFGAVFQTKDDVGEINFQTACRSITQVPGHQVVFDPDYPLFADACYKAIEMEEVIIHSREPKEVKTFSTVDAVLAEIEFMKQ